MSGDDAKLRQLDAEARRLAQTEFERPVVLEAGAGSGKTATLVARVLVWATGPGWMRAAEEIGDGVPEEIAARVLDGITAITFTDRAAVEMKERIAQAIEKLTRVEPKAPIGLSLDDLPATERLRVRSRALLVEIDRLHVETIHAFCRRTLARHPLEAGLRPEFTIDADGSAVENAVQDLLATRLGEFYGEQPDADAMTLLEQGLGPESIAEVLRDLAGADCPAERFEQDPYPEAVVAQTRDEFADLLGEILNLGAEAFRSGSRVKAALGAIEAIENLRDGVIAAEDAEGLAEAVADFDVGSSKLSSWAKGTLTKSEAACIDDEEAERRFTTAIDGMRKRVRALGRWNPALLRPSFRLLARLLADLRGGLRRSGVVTYFDLLAEMRTLLSRRPELRASIRAGIDQLLVDEVQDTDPIQYDIVRMLALEGDERPGLFLVGDPKQSIYAFRSADLGAYEDFIEEVEEQRGLKRPLVVNFRSDPPILAEVERLLEPIMLEEASQPAFQKLLPAPDKLEATGHVDDRRQPIEYWNSWRRDPLAKKRLDRTTADDARGIEAETIAADMRDLHEQGVPYKEMAILLRATTQQETYLAALRDAGVPYLVEKDRQFYRRREIMDATSLLVAVLDPHDHLALLGWLRSSAVGVPDSALLPLWRGGFPGELSSLRGPDAGRLEKLDGIVEAAGKAISGELESASALPRWTALLRMQLRILATLRKSVREQPADRFLDELRRKSGFELRESARFLGAHRLANLERFHRMVLDRWSESDVGAHEIVGELLRGISEERDEAEGSPGDEGTDAVRVMSVHKAKGLDFGHVYLAALHQGHSGGVNRRPVSVQREGDRRELRIFGAETPGLFELEERSDRVAQVEAVRNLYVAVTRAAERVVLAGRWPKDEAEPKELTRCHSPMDLIVHRRGFRPFWDDAESADLDREFRDPDDAGVLWRMPDHGGREVEARGPEAIGTEPLTPSIDVADVLARRSACTTREKERAVTPASSLAQHEPGRRDWPDEHDQDEDAPVLDRGDAMRLGTAMHRALELWPREKKPADWLSEIADDPKALLPGEERDELLAYLSRRLRALADSEIAIRLESIADSILARELPCVLKRDPGVVVGAIDLLYRDTSDGQIVVVDFKSDRISESPKAAAARYREQGRAYVEAVTGSGGDETIRFEIWFLDADLVVPVSVD